MGNIFVSQHWDIATRRKRATRALIGVIASMAKVLCGQMKKAALAALHVLTGLAMRTVVD